MGAGEGIGGGLGHGGDVVVWDQWLASGRSRLISIVLVVARSDGLYDLIFNYVWKPVINKADAIHISCIV